MRTVLPVSSGEMLEEEFFETLGPDQIPAGKRHWRSATTHRRYRGWQKVCHGRHRPSLVPLLWPQRWLVASRPGELRNGPGEGSYAGGTCAYSSLLLACGVNALGPAKSTRQPPSR